MSIAFPIIETVAMVAGVGISALTAALSTRTRTKRSDLLDQYLKNEEEWKSFEKSRLADILSDHMIDDAEWSEILQKLDHVAAEINKTHEEFENRVGYLARSEKSKKLLVSDYISKKSSKIAA